MDLYQSAVVPFMIGRSGLEMSNRPTTLFMIAMLALVMSFAFAVKFAVYGPFLAAIVSGVICIGSVIYMLKEAHWYV
jgi:hypothetical protein